jgi:multicomponent Na+:H+ antiporter subunit G
MEILGNILLLLGAFVAFSGALGVLRMPDFYSRLHPAGTTDTLAQLLLIAGLVLGNFDTDTTSLLVTGKLIVISLLLLVTTPAATHAISRAAYLSGLQPWSSPDAETEEATSSGSSEQEES